MKKISRIMVLLGVLSLILAANVWAQPAGPGPGMGGRGPGGGKGPGGGMGMQYNPQAVETVSGEVTQMQQSPRQSRGVHLQMKTAKETLMVILGPATFLEQQKLTLAVGDKVEIKGSRMQHPQMAMIIAGEVKKGDQVVKLRDEQGKPLWPRRGPKRD